MTPPQSSQPAEPAQVADAVWSKRMQLVVRRKTRDLLMADPHFQDMKARAQRLVFLLIIWHDPATGHLMIRTKNATLTTWLVCSETTLRRARHEAIDAGFIVGYAPGDGGRGVGDGGWAGRYTIARTPEEAAEARELRKAPDAPYWPAIPERERLGMPILREQRGRPRADKDAQEDAGKPPQRQRTQKSARDMAHGASKRVQEVLPETPVIEATETEIERDRRRREEVYAELKRVRESQNRAS